MTTDPQRYALVRDETSQAGSGQYMELDPEGEWVQWTEVAARSTPPSDLRDALAEARLEPPDNVCASCGHGGWDHDLGNWCLVCPRPDDWDRTAKSPTGAKVDAGWCFFASMTDDEKWSYGLRHPAVLAALDRSGPAEGLREAVLTGPDVVFPNLPHHPTLADVLDAVAHWMDGVDDRDGNPNNDVQTYLRERAVALRAALAATPTASPTDPDR